MVYFPKFRAWIKTSNQMGIPTSIEFDEGDVDYICFDYEEAGYSPKTVTLMQSTGLFDKNGVEIFEGDAIRTGGNTYEVKFGSQRFINFTGVGFYLVKHYSEFFVKEQLMLDGSKYEVIGNIYENPELVEVKND